MIWAPYSPSGAFSLISWLFVTECGHTIYQIEAEYHSYRMVSFKLLLIKNLKLLEAESKEIPNIWLHCVIILDIIKEGTMSQISDLGPSFFYQFM